jgi:predicted phosphodiesterase
MKIAVISDMHGNATALEAVLEDIISQRADQVVVLGDICYRGPEPKKH